MSQLADAAVTPAALARRWSPAVQTAGVVLEWLELVPVAVLVVRVVALHSAVNLDAAHGFTAWWLVWDTKPLR
jgi:EamA domain-containing membrane protein RarD